MMKKYVKLFEFSININIQISRKEFFLLKNNIQRSVNFLKSGFYYSTLAEKNFKIHCMNRNEKNL